jgi:hypothetical protein
MFSRRCNSGIHFLHKEFPHGKVTGSRRGYEHCGHCTSLTICRASFEASRGMSEGVVLEVEEFGNVEMADRRERGVSLSGKETINASSFVAGPLDLSFWVFGVDV